MTCQNDMMLQDLTCADLEAHRDFVWKGDSDRAGVQQLKQRQAVPSTNEGGSIAKSLHKRKLQELAANLRL